MGNVKTIVAALDLEAGSDAVLRRAAQLAADHGARLVAVHVIEAPLRSPALAPSLSEQSERALEAHLSREAEAAISALLAGGALLSAETDVCVGAPHAVITGVADKQDADLVVIGPGKCHSLGEKILGSTADRVVRTSPAPVLVARGRSAVPYRKVAAAVDFSAQSAAAAKSARRLAPAAQFELVHAFSVPLTFEQAMLRAATSEADRQAYRAAKLASAREALSQFGREVFGSETVGTQLLDGEPGPALARLARSGDIDLLALGPNGHGLILRTLLGSVTQRVLREAACDVLVATVPD